MLKVENVLSLKFMRVLALSDEVHNSDQLAKFDMNFTWSEVVEQCLEALLIILGFIF